MRNIAPVALALALLIGCSSAPARAACPADTTWTGCILMVTPHYGTDPALACYSSDALCSAWQTGQPCPAACYDLPAGRVEAVLPGGDCANAVTSADDYWVTGIPAGWLTAFFAQLHVEGVLGDVAAAAEISAEGDRFAADTYGGADSPLDQTLVVPLWQRAGEVFRVQLQVSVWNAATPDPAHLAGTLQFTGLPAGAVVHSCQGYDLPVPTRVESWGRVKALYR